MHDITYANKIVSLLKEKLTGEERRRHITVSVALGPFTHVTQESLRAAFEAQLDGDEFKNVTLSVETGEAAVKCRKCMAVTKTARPVFACPACGEPDFDIIDGDIFLIKAIEIAD